MKGEEGGPWVEFGFDSSEGSGDGLSEEGGKSLGRGDEERRGGGRGGSSELVDASRSRLRLGLDTGEGKESRGWRGRGRREGEASSGQNRGDVGENGCFLNSFDVVLFSFDHRVVVRPRPRRPPPSPPPSIRNRKLPRRQHRRQT